MPSPWIRLPPRPETPTGSPRRRANRSSIDRTCGSFVEPGTPLSKAQRKDSRVGPTGLDGQSDANEEPPREGFAWLATKMRLDDPQLDIFTPEATSHTSKDFLQGRTPGNLRALIIAVILFLIVFGAIRNLVGYLLLATRATASCTPSTVYVPVTRYVSTSAAASAVEGSTSMLTIYSTATEYATTTSYLTLQPAVVATSSDGHYYFTTDSAGSTGWLNGISPPATASLTMLTTSIFVTPVMLTETLPTTTATITSTAVIYQTVTVPAYTSTTYSLIEPDTTLTSTSTHYVTYTVSQVSSADAATTTGPRPTYSGPGTSGWNSSVSDVPEATEIAAAAAGDPQLTTMTEIHYWGEGDMTTSTTTNFITTSIRVAYTTVVTPSIPEPSDNPDFVTTVTALPVTITYSSGEQYSTSIAFNGSAVTTVASTSQASTSSPFQTGVSISTAPLASSVTPAARSSSSGIFTNSTSQGTLSAAGYSTGAIPDSSLSSSTIAADGSTVGPLSSGFSSSTSLLSSSVPTAPGPVSTSTSIGKISSSSSTGLSSLSSAGSSTSISSSITATTSSLLSFGGSILLSVGNATTSSFSFPGSSTAALTTSSVSSASTSEAPTLSAAAYESYNPLTSLSTATTAGPLSGSLSSSANSSAVSSTVSSSSSAPSGSAPSSTWSTSVRSRSSSTSTSGRSTSLAAPEPNITVGISSATTLTGSPTSSISLLSWSQTYIQSSTSSLTGIPASAASAMPSTGCGEYGDFMLDFDNLPNFTPNNQDQTDITQAPPIKNPYHHFAFSDGYVYAPDPKVPFEPISQPHLAVFLGNGTGMKATQAGHTIEDGEFANGPYEASSAFWFDAFSAWLGCDNEGPEVCTLVMNAYTYDARSNDEVLAFTQNATIAGCPGFKDCKLQKVEFPTTFRKLSGLQIQAYVKNEERMFFMDDVAMRWTDNSCVAGLTRQRAR